jgi:hypothetical protein
VVFINNSLIKAQAPSHHPSQSLAIFAVLYSNSITAYGSPIQASELEGVSMTAKLHQSFRREEPHNNKVGCSNVPSGDIPADRPGSWANSFPSFWSS